MLITFSPLWKCWDVFKCKWRLSPVFLITFLSITLHCKLGAVKYREYKYGLFNCHYLYYRCFFVFVEREKFLMQLKGVSTRRETQCDTCLPLSLLDCGLQGLGSNPGWCHQGLTTRRRHYLPYLVAQGAEETTTATSRTTSIENWFYILPTNLMVL